MSSDPFGSNPYAPPKPLGPPQYQPAPLPQMPPGPWAMDYFGAFDMIHRRPDWFVNLLLMFVCALIPVVGSIVVIGYCFEVVEILHRTNGSYYPKFDFGRFVEYLLRGIGPFLLQLALNMIGFVMGLVGYLAVVGTVIAASGGGNGNEAVAGAGILVVFAFFGLMILVLSIGFGFINVPLSLRGGLSSDIAGSFNFGWAVDFIKKTWLEMLLVFLFQFGVSFVVMLFVAITCYVGLIVAIGYMLLVNSWLQYQLYRLYLSRGGEPVPFKPSPLPLPMM